MQNRKLSDFERNMRISQEFEFNLMVLLPKTLRKVNLCCRNHKTMLILPYKSIPELGVALGYHTSLVSTLQTLREGSDLAL